MKNLAYKFGSAIASLALLLSVTTATRTCTFIVGQPELPESVKKLRKF